MFMTLKVVCRAAKQPVRCLYANVGCWQQNRVAHLLLVLRGGCRNNG